MSKTPFRINKHRSLDNPDQSYDVVQVKPEHLDDICDWVGRCYPQLAGASYSWEPESKENPTGRLVIDGVNPAHGDDYILWDGNYFSHLDGRLFDRWLSRNPVIADVDGDKPSYIGPNGLLTNIIPLAEDILNGERQSVYGDPVESHEKIAALWSPVLGVELTAHQVALCMLLLKVVRAANSEELHLDSYVDMVGYATIAGSAKYREKNPKEEHDPLFDDPIDIESTRSYSRGF